MGVGGSDGYCRATPLMTKLDSKGQCAPTFSQKLSSNTFWIIFASAEYSVVVLPTLNFGGRSFLTINSWSDGPARRTELTSVASDPYPGRLHSCARFQFSVGKTPAASLVPWKFQCQSQFMLMASDNFFSRGLMWAPNARKYVSANGATTQSNSRRFVQTG